MEKTRLAAEKTDIAIILLVDTDMDERHIPIFTFINKMDRDARDTFELLDEIENVLGIRTCPMNWPIGSGKEFKGVYDRETLAAVFLSLPVLQLPVWLLLPVLPA